MALIHLLLVEDNPGDARLVKEIVQEIPDATIELVWAERMSEALAQLAGRTFDLVLLDLALPDSEGMATLHSVLGAAPDTAVVVLTGFSNAVMIPQALRAGAQDYLGKDEISPRVLSRVIHHALARTAYTDSLRESLALNTALLESIPFGMHIVDEQGHILSQNSIMKALAGPASLGLTCWELYRDDRQQCWNCPLREPAPLGETHTLETTGVLGGRTFEISHTRMMYQGQKAVLEVFRDITARRRAEEERLALTAQLHQAQKLESLGGLAGGVAHDINNVLGAILGLASGHLEQLPASDPLGRSLETITKACLRGRDVVRSLLYFARKDLGTIGPVDLNALAREILPLLDTASLKRVQIRTDLQEPLPCIQGDAGSLSHALMNLCVNAFDAMPEGGDLLIQTRRRPDGGIELCVRDTGTGMTEEVRKRAMEPFFTTKPVGKGTGLGLAMVYGVVQAHQGKLDIQSELGAGTAVAMVFPVPEVPLLQPAPADPPRAAGRTEAHSGRKLRILLVDDDELILEAIGPLMQEVLGYQVQTASGGQEALALIEAGLEVDVVILDMNMPRFNGAQTLARLLALRPAQRVLMATGNSEDSIAPLLVGHANVSSLHKPYSLKDLEMKLEACALNPGL